MDVRLRKVLVTDHAWTSLDIERELLAEVGAELVVAATGDDDELIGLAPEADAILTNWKRLTVAGLEAAQGCLVVSRYGVGVDNIPVEQATELGILVVNVPDFCLEEVSDHAMALILACARRVVAFARSTREGRWDLVGLGRGLPRLREQTLGLVGYGSIARALVPKARGFGMHVIAYTPRLGTGSPEDGVECTNDLAHLLAKSDYVSLHVPATPETSSLIGEEQLRLMKPTRTWSTRLAARSSTSKRCTAR